MNVRLRLLPWYGAENTALDFDRRSAWVPSSGGNESKNLEPGPRIETDRRLSAATFWQSWELGPSEWVRSAIQWGVAICHVDPVVSSLRVQSGQAHHPDGYWGSRV